jgi:hypothetical protein
MEGADFILAAESSWTGILVAALGSSALGAIVGGYMTTRMQSRSGREEAWRTRLIEAADDLDRVLVQTVTLLGTFLGRAERGELRLRTDRGQLTKAVQTDVESAWHLLQDVEVRLGHLELLVGPESDVYQCGWKAADTLTGAVALLRGRATAAERIVAICRYRAGDEGAFAEISPADYGHVWPSLLYNAWDPPDGPSLDPSDDRSLGQWARRLHHIAGSQIHNYMREARAYIENYKL